mgnify:CR=1 FL=1
MLTLSIPAISCGHCARAITDAIQRAFGLTEVEIRTGDVALFNALIDALELYPVWRRRLIKDFNRKVSLTEDIERLTLATAPGEQRISAPAGCVQPRAKLHAVPVQVRGPWPSRRP